MKNNLIMAVIAAVIIGGGIGFLAGMKYQQSKQPAFTRQFNGSAGRGGGGQAGGGNRTGFRPVTGDILSTDANSITVKTSDGGSAIVLFTNSTAINKAASASAGDLIVGERVAVYGQQNPDGSVTAQNIQLNPILRVGGGNGQPGTPNQ